VRADCGAFRSPRSWITDSAITDLSAQRAIVNFLDRETTRIDQLIEKKLRFVDLVEFEHQSFVTRSVTIGLDPTVPMKVSGYTWHKHVPEHWVITRLKFLCSHIVDCLHETPQHGEGDYPSIRTADVSRGKLRIDGAKRVSGAEYQHRILFWGILGALILRAIFIATGSALISNFHWIIYIFGAFLVFTGIKMFLQGDEKLEPEKNPVVRLFERWVPVSKSYHGQYFFVRQAGKTKATLLMLVLIVIETTDVIFAVDSIPAIFAITQDPFIVYTSNVFAILGLRALYFMLAGVMHYKSNASSPFHLHENCEHFYFIIEGKGTVETPEGTRPVEPGSLVFIPPEAKHRLRATETGLFYFEFQAPNRFKTTILDGTPDDLRWDRVDGGVWVQT